MPRLYDLMLLIDASAPEDRQSAIVAEVQGMLEAGGSVTGAHDWGSRRIAYEIDHRPEAAYHLFQFESDSALLDRLNHSLKIMDDVLRFRIIHQAPGAPPVPPRPEPVRARREDEPDGRVAARAAADAPPEQPEGEAEAAPQDEAEGATQDEPAPADEAGESAPADEAPGSATETAPAAEDGESAAEPAPAAETAETAAE